MVLGLRCPFSALLATCVLACATAPEPAPWEQRFGFDGEMNPWKANGGQWSIRDGVCTQDTIDGTAALTLPHWYDEAGVTLRLRLGQVAASGGSVGVRLLARTAEHDESGVTVWLSDNGMVRVLWEGRELQQMPGFQNPFDWHEVELEVRDQRIVARIGTLPTWVGTDATLHGARGFLQLVTDHAAAQFDDVTVRRLGAPPTYTPDPARPGPPPLPLGERAFYCPAATTGAGASLMQFWTEGELEERIQSFTELPDLLATARRAGTSTIYLVDWWDGHYTNKGDYAISEALGGSAAFRTGIEAVHAAGGKVVLYLEPYIIHRESTVGRRYGAAWAMMNPDGTYRKYFNRDDYYILFPGTGSGWVDYLADLCERLARDWRIDGVHLDSYGTQWDQPDFHPSRPGARNPDVFNAGAVRLVREVRERMRRHVPHAVVLLEGAENEPLLDICDGAQIESLAVFRRKPWHALSRYNIYIADFDLRAMKEILDAGCHLALCDYWFRDVPSEKTLDRLRQGMKRGEARRLHQDLWQMVNIATANDFPVPTGAPDPRQVHQVLIDRQWSILAGGDRAPVPELVALVDAYAPLLAQLRERPHRLPADVLREWLELANKTVSITGATGE